MELMTGAGAMEAAGGTAIAMVGCTMAGWAMVGMERMAGGRDAGNSYPFNFMLMSLQAMENSFRSI